VLNSFREHMGWVELVRWPWDTEVQYSFGQEMGGGGVER